MELTAFFKSVLEQDSAPIVLCDLQHTIVYMNPAAIRRYASRGGAALLGRSLLDCHGPDSRKIIGEVLDWFAKDRTHNSVYESRNAAENKDVYMVALRDENGSLIGYYEKHEYRTPETAAFYDFSPAAEAGPAGRTGEAAGEQT